MKYPRVIATISNNTCSSECDDWGCSEVDSESESNSEEYTM